MVLVFPGARFRSGSVTSRGELGGMLHTQVSQHSSGGTTTFFEQVTSAEKTTDRPRVVVFEKTPNYTTTRPNHRGGYRLALLWIKSQMPRLGTERIITLRLSVLLMEFICFWCASLADTTRSIRKCNSPTSYPGYQPSSSARDNTGSDVATGVHRKWMTFSDFQLLKATE